MQHMSCSIVQGTVDKALTGMLGPALQKALPACFESIFQKSIIPAFEAACQTMFKEVGSDPSPDVLSTCTPAAQSRQTVTRLMTCTCPHSHVPGQPLHSQVHTLAMQRHTARRLHRLTAATETCTCAGPKHLLGRAGRASPGSGRGPCFHSLQPADSPGAGHHADRNPGPGRARHPAAAHRAPR